MQLLAEKGDARDCAEMLEVMRQDGVTPTDRILALAAAAADKTPSRDTGDPAGAVERLLPWLKRRTKEEWVDIANRTRFGGSLTSHLARGVSLAYADFKVPPREYQPVSYESHPLLSELQSSMSASALPRPLSSVEDLEPALRRQLEIERRPFINVESVHTIDREQREQAKKAARVCDVLLSDWRDKLLLAFETRVQKQLAFKADLPGDPITIYPFLTALQTSSYVEVMLNEVC